MKKTLVLFCLTLLLSSLQAQTITHGLLNADAGYYTNSTATLTFSQGVVIDEFDLGVTVNVPTLLSMTKPRIFPNPGKDVVYLSTPEHSFIEFFDASGKIHRTVHANVPETTVNISDLAKGLYLLRVRSESGVWIEKFLKR